MGAGFMGPGFGLRYPGPTIGSPEDFAKDYKPEEDKKKVTSTPEGTIGVDRIIPIVSSAVKVATPETYELYPSSPSAVVAAQLFLETLGGSELIEILRHDLINGYNTRYQPIKDAQIIATQFNAFNIIPLQDTLPNYLDNFPIRLEERIPSTTSDKPSNVTIDVNGIITIELVNLKPDETVEVEIVYQGQILSDTIYDTGASS
jgi:hypothetical protein